MPCIPLTDANQALSFNVKANTRYNIKKILHKGKLVYSVRSSVSLVVWTVRWMHLCFKTQNQKNLLSLNPKGMSVITSMLTSFVPPSFVSDKIFKSMFKRLQHNKKKIGQDQSQPVTHSVLKVKMNVCFKFLYHSLKTNKVGHNQGKLVHSFISDRKKCVFQM